MKISRKRIAELDQWGVNYVSTYVGPEDFGRKLCKEGQPFAWDQGFLEDHSKWVCDRIIPEPDWQIAQDGMGYWYVYQAPDGPHTRYLSQKWKSRGSAEAYLKLWKMDWWEDADDIH